jgi:hypothetical protein
VRAYNADFFRRRFRKGIASQEQKRAALLKIHTAEDLSFFSINSIRKSYKAAIAPYAQKASCAGRFYTNLQ